MIDCWNRRVGRHGQLHSIPACYELPRLIRECRAGWCVLIFPTDVGSQSAFRSPSRETFDCVEPFRERATEGVRDGLTEVISVRQGWPGNPSQACIDRFYLQAAVISPSENGEIVREILCERIV